ATIQRVPDPSLGARGDLRIRSDAPTPAGCANPRTSARANRLSSDLIVDRPGNQKGLQGSVVHGGFRSSDELRPVSPRCAMLIVPGRAALGAAKQARALRKGQAVCSGLRGLTARWIHLVTTGRPLSAAEALQLDELLAYGPRDDGLPVSPAGSVEMLTFFVTPRIGTTSPWSSKATDIAHVCGLASITRIERGIAYLA